MVNRLICGKNVHFQSKYDIILSRGKVLLDRKVVVNLFGKLLSRPSGKAIRSFIFFVLFYLYLWLDVDLRLIYHGGGVITNFPVFYRSWSFFSDFLSYPGGPVEYLAAFLAQFWYYSWAGAIVVTAVAWLICVCTGFFFRAVNAPTLRWVRFVPPVLLLILYTQYTFHFVTTVALLAALGFVCLYLKITPKNKSGAFVVFMVLSVVLYYLAGGAYLLFAVLCAIYELLFARRWQLGLMYLLSTAVIPYMGGIRILGVSPTNAFGKLLPSIPPRIQNLLTIVLVIYLLLPLTALGGGLWQMLVKEEIRKKLRNTYSKPVAEILSRYTATPAHRRVFESLVLIIITSATVFLFHDNQLRTRFMVYSYAIHKKWPQILTVAHRHHSNDYFMAHTVNRALYHTGRLGYDMFSYPQHPDALLLTGEKQKNVAHWGRFDTYIDLGLINTAEHDLTESLEILGEQPIFLERLVLVNTVKGKIGAAMVYLGALSKTLFGSGWASDYLEKLDTDSNVSADEHIQHLRSLLIKKDYGTDFPYEAEDICLDLLEANKQNRMAFEYLMALYLLTRQLDKFVQNLDRLDDFDYPDIPRLYEEAILLYAYHTRKTVDLYGRQITLESFQRFEGFKQVLSHYKGNEQAVLDELTKHFSDSYFFYYTCVHLGLKK